MRLGVLLLAASALAIPTGAAAQAPAEPGPGSEEVVERADRLLREGRAAAARGVLERWLETRPASLPALEALERVLEGSGDPAALLGPAERAVRISPGEAGLRRVWIRALVAAGRSDSARLVAARWAGSAPAEPSAHLALAEALAAGGDLQAAIAALQRGREEAGEDPELARDLSALFLRLGSWSSAADEWTRLLGEGPVGVAAVLEALSAWPGDPGPALAALWDGLARRGVELVPARAGVSLAFELDEGPAARRIVRANEGDAQVRLTRAHLADARRRGAWGEAAWAAGRLADASAGGARLEWRATAAEASLSAADTAGARQAFRALAGEAEPGSGPHRLAMRRWFSLRAAERGRAGEAETILRDYRRRYTEPGPEATAMTAELALAYAREGREAEARRVLDEAEPGEGSAESRAPLERIRGLLAFWAGRPAEAIERLRGAVSREPGTAAGRGTPTAPAPTAAERTRWIGLLAALETADSTAAGALGRVLGRLAREPEAVGADEVFAALDGDPSSEGRAALLALAADGMREAGRGEAAAAAWRRLAEEHPGTLEAAAAMLELGRTLRVEDPDAARSWLRRLIVEQPESAVSPLARRLLAEMPDSGPGGP